MNDVSRSIFAHFKHYSLSTSLVHLISGLVVLETRVSFLFCDQLFLDLTARPLNLGFGQIAPGFSGSTSKYAMCTYDSTSP